MLDLADQLEGPLNAIATIEQTVIATTGTLGQMAGSAASAAPAAADAAAGEAGSALAAAAQTGGGIASPAWRRWACRP